MRFPALDGRDIDTIIRKCWNEEYSSMKASKIDTLQLAQDEPLPTPRVMDTREYEATQKECEQLVKDEITESTEWQPPRQFVGYDRVSKMPCEDSQKVAITIFLDGLLNEACFQLRWD